MVYGHRKPLNRICLGISLTTGTGISGIIFLGPEDDVKLMTVVANYQIFSPLLTVCGPREERASCVRAYAIATRIMKINSKITVGELEPSLGEDPSFFSVGENRI